MYDILEGLGSTSNSMRLRISAFFIASGSSLDRFLARKSLALARVSYLSGLVLEPEVPHVGRKKKCMMA